MNRKTIEGRFGFSKNLYALTKIKGCIASASLGGGLKIDGGKKVEIVGPEAP